MELAPAEPSLFEGMPDDSGATVRVATNVQPKANIAFKISGTGTFPAETQNPQSPGPVAGQAEAEQPGGTREGPGGGIGRPIDAPNPMEKYVWWILGGFVVVLAAGAWFFYQQPAAEEEEPEIDPTKPAKLAKRMKTAARAGAAAVAAAPRPGANGRSGMILDALKEELFALESERLAGKISAEEYRKQKDALDVTLQRALSRQK